MNLPSRQLQVLLPSCTRCLVSQWIHVPGSFGTNSTQFLREGDARAVRTWKPGLSPLGSGTHLFGACHAGGAQENLEFSGRRLRGSSTTWQSFVRCSPVEFKIMGGFRIQSFLGRQWIPVYVSLRRLFCSDCGFSAVAVHRWSSIFPVVVQRPIPMVFCSEDHKCSPVAPQHGDLCPCCTGRAVSLVSGSLLFGVRCSPVEYQTTDFPGLQEICTYAALSGSTVDTCSASVTRSYGKKEFHTFSTCLMCLSLCNDRCMVRQCRLLCWCRCCV